MGLARKRVGLALGGGGTRGMAHIGVIDALEKAEIPIDCIAGTSVGSLVGAAYAAGMRSDRLIELALQIRWRDLACLARPGRGFVSFDKMQVYIADVAGNLTFAELEIPFAVVTADLETGEQVVLRDGPLAPSVQASCSVPGIVTPVEIGGRLLIDGGVVNNLPISVSRDLGADVVIAVGLGTPPGGHPKGPFQTAVAALDFLLMRAADDPSTADIHLSIPVWGFGSMVRTSQRKKFIALGQKATEDALPTIRAMMA